MIPKEQLTAWQRWELASFDPEKTDTHVLPPTVNELDQIREQARQEGYAAGHAEGYQTGLAAGATTGHEQGYQTGLDKAQQDNIRLSEQLNQLILNFDAELTQADKTIAADLVTFASDLAGAMLKTALAIKPELIIPLVSQAIAALPVTQRNGKLYLNPDDAVLVRQHLHEEVIQHGWQLIEDEHIPAGGCRIETHSNLLDASLATRWKRLMLALGQHPEWLGE